MNIAVYPGSYNPIHLGHLSIAKATLQSESVDEVWMMVTPHNPMKEKGSLWEDSHRLQMVRLATQEEEGIVASDFEFTLPQPSYTYKTLLSLSEAFPEHQFRLLIGSDNLEVFSKWRNADEIREEYGLLVYPRPGFVGVDKVSMQNVEMLSGKLYEVSSTAIREHIENGLPLSHLTPPAVESYLREFVVTNRANE